MNGNESFGSIKGKIFFYQPIISFPGRNLLCRFSLSEFSRSTALWLRAVTALHRPTIHQLITRSLDSSECECISLHRKALVIVDMSHLVSDLTVEP
jgi:hypothetical protein